MSSPLVDQGGAPLAPSAVAPEFVRPQASPFPQLAGLILQRVRLARNALPEAWRLTFALRTGIGPEGRGLVLDMTRGASGRELARALRALASQLDAMADTSETPANDPPPSLPASTDA